MTPCVQCFFLLGALLFYINFLVRQPGTQPDTWHKKGLWMWMWVQLLQEGIKKMYSKPAATMTVCVQCFFWPSQGSWGQWRQIQRKEWQQAVSCRSSIFKCINIGEQVAIQSYWQVSLFWGGICARSVEWVSTGSQKGPAWEWTLYFASPVDCQVHFCWGDWSHEIPNICAPAVHWEGSSQEDGTQVAADAVLDQKGGVYSKQLAHKLLRKSRQNARLLCAAWLCLWS